jgi:protein-arginine kinase activator protein McsA
MSNMNRDPQPENRDPAIEHGDPEKKPQVFHNVCHKCDRTFRTLDRKTRFCTTCELNFRSL